MTGGAGGGRALGGTAQPGDGMACRTTSITALRGMRALLAFSPPITTRPADMARTACPCAANLPSAATVGRQLRSMLGILVKAFSLATKLLTYID